MQSLLERVAPVTSTRPRRMLIYGVPGIGKSTFASRAPGAIFIRTEDGDIDCTALPVATCLSDVLQALDELATSDHKFRTVVIDSTSPLDRLCQQAACEEDGKSSIEDFGYGKGYVKSAEKWDEVLASLDRCVNRGMAVILIGHAVVEHVNNPEGDDYDRYAPRLDKRVAPKIVEWCSEVLFANYAVMTKTTEVGTGKFATKKTKAIGESDRVLRTSARPYCIAKNRLPQMPEEIELNWDVFASYLKRKDG